MTTSRRNLFISYRHSDNSQFAERIRDWLVNKYGRDQVFMDFDSIPPFVDFEKYISQKVHNCDVLIVIVGPSWGKLFQEKITQGAKDYVKFELELALQERKFIAPICIEGASMPSAKDIPSNLHPILNLNAANLRSGSHFFDDMKRIIDAIESQLPSMSSQNALSSDNNDKADVISSEEKIVVNINVQMVFHHQVLNYNEAQALTLVYQAGEKWQKRDFDGAISDCTEAIKLVPNFAWAFNGRGAAKRGKGDLDGAFSDYDQAIFYDPTLAEAYHNKAIAYHSIKEYDNAIVYYSKAVEISPQSETYDRLGTAYFRKNDIKKAFANYDKAIELDPQNWMAYNNSGGLYYENKNIERSLEDINEALSIASKISPSPSELEKVYCSHARIMSEQGKDVEALTDLIEAIKVNPDCADIYDLTAHICSKRGETKEAIKYYDIAIDKSPSNPTYYVGRGWAKYNEHDIYGAIKDYDETIRLNPSIPDAYNNRGIAKVDLGKFDDAIVDYSIAIELKLLRLEWAYSNRSMAHAGKKNYLAAIEDCSEAIKINPQYANAYINRSDAYFSIGMIREGIDDLEKYLEHGGGELNNDRLQVEQTIRELKSSL